MKYTYLLRERPTDKHQLREANKRAKKIFFEIENLEIQLILYLSNVTQFMGKKKSIKIYKKFCITLYNHFYNDFVIIFNNPLRITSCIT